MNKIEKQVMASVATIYIARRLSSRTALECYALFLSALSITLFVSMPHVASNFIHAESLGLPAIFSFLLSAVIKTNLVVQAALVMGALALAALMRDMVRPTAQRRFA